MLGRELIEWKAKKDPRYDAYIEDLLLRLVLLTERYVVLRSCILSTDHEKLTITVATRILAYDIEVEPDTVLDRNHMARRFYDYVNHFDPHGKTTT